MIGSFGHQSPFIFGRNRVDIFIEAINLLASKLHNLAVMVVGSGWRNIVKKLKRKKIHVLSLLSKIT